MSEAGKMSEIRGTPVSGLLVDEQTRCEHYNGPLDVIAIKFKCCGKWYPCFECHAERADHVATVWPLEEFRERAVLCGVCGRQLTVEEYLDCGNLCPTCNAPFNPGCARHRHLYFEQSA